MDPDYILLKSSNLDEFDRIISLRLVELQKKFGAGLDPFLNSIVRYNHFWFDYTNYHLKVGKNFHDPSSLPLDTSGNYQHENWRNVFLDYSQNSSYFNIISTDLFNTILLQTGIEDILSILEKLCSLSYERCGMSKRIWMMLYNRDIDSDGIFYKPGLNEDDRKIVKFAIKEVYLDFVRKFNNSSDKFRTAVENNAYNTLIRLPKPINLNSYAFEALRNNNLKIFKYLVDLGVDIHYDENIMFNFAIVLGFLEIVEFMIEKGINIHLNDEYAAKQAIKYKHIDILKILVENGANVKDPGLIHGVLLGENVDLPPLDLFEPDKIVKTTTLNMDIKMLLYLLEKGAEPPPEDVLNFLTYSLYVINPELTYQIKKFQGKY